MSTNFPGRLKTSIFLTSFIVCLMIGINFVQATTTTATKSKSAIFSGSISIDRVGGKPLSSAKISLSPNGRTVRTGVNGTFRFSGLRSGKYDVTISKYGYNTYKTTLTIANGQVVSKLYFLSKNKLPSASLGAKAPIVYTLDDLDHELRVIAPEGTYLSKGAERLCLQQIVGLVYAYPGYRYAKIDGVARTGNVFIKNANVYVGFEGFLTMGAYSSRYLYSFGRDYYSFEFFYDKTKNTCALLPRSPSKDPIWRTAIPTSVRQQIYQLALKNKAVQSFVYQYPTAKNYLDGFPKGFGLIEWSDAKTWQANSLSKTAPPPSSSYMNISFRLNNNNGCDLNVAVDIKKLILSTTGPQCYSTSSEPVLAPAPSPNATPDINSPTFSRDANRLTEIKEIQTAIELYYGEQNKYPVSAQPITLGDAGHKCLSSTNGFAASCTGTIYDPTLPSNPSPGGAPYVYTSDGSSYTLTFSLEGSISNLSSGPHTATEYGIK